MLPKLANFSSIVLQSPSFQANSDKVFCLPQKMCCSIMWFCKFSTMSCHLALNKNLFTTVFDSCWKKLYFEIFVIDFNVFLITWVFLKSGRYLWQALTHRGCKIKNFQSKQIKWINFLTIKPKYMYIKTILLGISLCNWNDPKL